MPRELGTWKHIGLALLGLVLWPAVAFAQLWTATTPGAYGAMFALDASGNAYVAGHVPRSTMLLTKYDPRGAQLWQRVFDSPGTLEESTWVTLDAAGRVVVAGRIVDSGGNPNGLVVLKYDSAGTLLWQRVTPAAFAYASRVLTDAQSNIYVLGRMWLANASGNTTHDIVALKLAPDGSLLWQRSFGLDNFSADSPASMALTPSGQLVVVGGTTGQMLMAAYDANGNSVWSKAIPAATGALDVAVGRTGEVVVVGGAAAGSGYLVVKHDANFNEVWRKAYAVGQYGTRAVVDSLGNIVVTGIAGVYSDWMTIKLDPAGTLLWSRQYDRHAYNDESPGFIWLDTADSVLITGRGGPAPASPTGDLSLLATVTVRYSASGQQVWSRTTSATLPGIAVRVSPDANVYVLGQSPQTLMNYGADLSMNLQPVVAAAASPTSGNAPLAVNFSSAGSNDPDGFGAPLSYWWAFGDGRYSTEAHPVHSYAAGAYVARLTVTDRNGAAETSAPISISSVAPPPTPTALTLAAATVTGGANTTATVALSNNKGATVALASSNPQVASVPASIVVPAGSTTASFTVKTSRVKTGATVTLQASANDASTRAILTVRPR